MRRVGDLLQKVELPPPHDVHLRSKNGLVVVMTARWLWRLDCDGVPESVTAIVTRVREADYAYTPSNNSPVSRAS